MGLISTEEIHSNPLDRWGNIKFYDYKVTMGDGSVTPADFQTLVTLVGVRRASAIEGEITALAIKMRKRNTMLDQLGGLLSTLSKISAQFHSDKGDEEISHDGWSTSNIEALKILADKWTQENGSTVRIYVGTYNQTYTPNVKEKRWKSTIEMWNQLAKSKVEALNNGSQIDLNTLQTYVGKRDESYTMVNTLMSHISDTRSNLIKNI